MSKRHQASRRRTYGRRQHELHERTERGVGVLDWTDDLELLPETVDRWAADPLARVAAGEWMNARGMG
jgi:hypothetical protein